MFKYFMGVSTSSASSSSSSSPSFVVSSAVHCHLPSDSAYTTWHTRTHICTHIPYSHTHTPKTHTHAYMQDSLVQFCRLHSFCANLSETVKEAENPLSYFSLARKLSEKPFKDFPHPLLSLLPQAWITSCRLLCFC